MTVVADAPASATHLRPGIGPRGRGQLAIAVDVLSAALLLSLAVPSGLPTGGLGLIAVVVTLVLAKIVFGHYRRDGLVLGKHWSERIGPSAQIGVVSAFGFVLVSAPFQDSIAASTIVEVTLAVTLSQLLVIPARRWLIDPFCADERVIVVGSRAAEAEVRRHLAVSGLGPFELVGRFTDVSPDRIGEVVGHLNAERLVIARSEDDDDHAVMCVAHAAQAAGANVSVFSSRLAMLGSDFQVEQIGASVALHARARSDEPRRKRIFDVVGAAVALLVMAPFFAVVAALIRLESGGPVFFRQHRIGRAGRTFAMVKFRSMVMDAEELKSELLHRNEASGGLFKVSNDPRVTRVGRFLRRTSLDELPQLLNVLKGEMSLVGPRPLVPEEDLRVEGWRRNRLGVRPGMTGPWQVMGSARIGMDDMAVLDNTYVSDWSIGYDVRVLLRTAAVVLGARGL